LHCRSSFAEVLISLHVGISALAEKGRSYVAGADLREAVKLRGTACLAVKFIGWVL
jgi:hypothetical protein